MEAAGEKLSIDAVRGRGITNPVTLPYNHRSLVIGFVRIFLREFHPLNRRERERGREISSIGGQQCHIVCPVRVRIASGHQLSMQRVPPSLRRGREQGLEELEYLPPRPGLMEIEGRTECFSS